MKQEPSSNSIEYAIECVLNGAPKPRLLLHTCCGPCASGVLEYLHPYFDITTYFYNPNIMPRQEFDLRLCALKDVISHFDGVKLIVPPQYEEDYTRLTFDMRDLHEGGARCTECFKLRMTNTALYLKTYADEYDFFATTLTVSPHKNAPLINQIGQDLAQKFGVKYLSSDFKKRNGYLRSTQLCKQWSIYRQSYCGCRWN